VSVFPAPFCVAGPGRQRPSCSVSISFLELGGLSASFESVDSEFFGVGTSVNSPSYDWCRHECNFSLQQFDGYEPE